MSRLIAELEAEFGTVDCRELIGRDIRTPEAHAAFIDSGIWRTVCLRQIEFAVRVAMELAAEQPAAAGATESG